MKAGDALPGWRRVLLNCLKARRGARKAATNDSPVAPLWRRGFREYERRPGERGSPGITEYRVVDIWDGRAVDEWFTFDMEHAERGFAGALEQAYDAELWSREGGEWELIKREQCG